MAYQLDTQSLRLPEGWYWRQLSADSPIDVWKRLQAFDETCYPNPEDRFKSAEYYKEFASKLRNDIHIWILVDGQNEDEWIGSIVCSSTIPFPSKEKRFSQFKRLLVNRVYISGIAVWPSYRGRGIAHLLLAKVIQEFDGQSLITRTRRDNLIVHRLLAAHGFDRFKTMQIRPDGAWVWYTRQAGEMLDQAGVLFDDKDTDCSNS